MLIAVMFLVSFAWAFVYVGLPFHIEQLSASRPAATLAWTGWIIGITSLAAVASGPIWARHAARGNPKAACTLVQALQGLGFFATALAGSLLELFLARFALGLVGSTSTFAFIIAGRVPDPTEIRRRLAAVQSAIMVGQVIGPLVGAVAAARLGFRPTFALGGVLLVVSAALVHWGVPRPPDPNEVAGPTRRAAVRDIVLASVVVAVASSQESFLAAVLPQILPGLGIGPADTLEVGGMLVFVSGAAAALGGLAAPRLAAEIPERRLLGILLAGSSVALVALGAAGSLWAYVSLRLLQSLCIAPLFPLVVARMARHGGGEAIGFVNAARVGSGFLGPIVATTVLAWGSPAALYLLLGVVGLITVPLARR